MAGASAIDEIEAVLPTIRLNRLRITSRPGPSRCCTRSSGMSSVLERISGNATSSLRSVVEVGAVEPHRGWLRRPRGDDPAMVVDAVRDEYRRRLPLGISRWPACTGSSSANLLQANQADAARDIVRELASAMPIDDVESAAAFEVLEAGIASLDGEHTAAVDHARRGVAWLDATDWLEERALGWLRFGRGAARGRRRRRGGNGSPPSERTVRGERRRPIWRTGGAPSCGHRSRRRRTP